MSQQQANMKCPADCGGRLEPLAEKDAYRCTQCGREVRQVVIENIEAFRREAQRDTPLADVAQAALEGVRDD